MSLFSSIQMAGNSLQANDIALQVVGQNISNANTPGYIRERVNFTPGPTQSNGRLLQGTGVRVESITQQIDKFLEQRLQQAGSDQASADTLQQTYVDLETTVGALNSDSNLSSSLDSFFSSIANIVDNPSDNSVRGMAVTQGKALTQSFSRMADEVQQLRVNANSQIEGMASEINRLTTDIGKLNGQITLISGGGTSSSAAVGLVDQRQQDLTALAKLVGVQTLAQPDGSVSVYVNGDYLVSGATVQPVNVARTADHGQVVSNLQIATLNFTLDPSTGQLHGLTASRDEVLGGFLDKLNGLAATVANEFNKVYSSGQGLTGYTQVTAQNAVTDPAVSLNAAGLAFAPGNGSFKITVSNTQSGANTTTTIPVPMLDSGHTTTLASLAAALNGVGGISATISGGKLSIAATAPNTQFSFSSDTSGALAALGINTFFTGSTASTLGVNPDLAADPSKFAASSGGVGADVSNATALAAFRDRPLAAQDGASIGSIYTDITNSLAQGSAASKTAATAAQVYQSSLASQETAVSGVNIDEEAIQMMQFQQAYAASAKYIATLNNLLTTLVQL